MCFLFITAASVPWVLALIALQMYHTVLHGLCTFIRQSSIGVSCRGVILKCGSAKAMAIYCLQCLSGFVLEVAVGIAHASSF